MTVSKLLNDKTFSNRIFAYVLNIEIKEFNKMELEVTKRLGFNLHIQEDTYRIYEEEIQMFSQIQNSILEELKWNYGYII